MTFGEKAKLERQKSPWVLTEARDEGTEFTKMGQKNTSLGAGNLSFILIMVVFLTTTVYQFLNLERTKYRIRLNTHTSAHTPDFKKKSHALYVQVLTAF